MPIYLCKPGSHSLEPWRHGIPVYAQPFPLGAMTKAVSGVDITEGTSTSITLSTTDAVTGTLSTTTPVESQIVFSNADTTTSTGEKSNSESSSYHHQPVPIRRIRHSEVILVDDVVFKFSNYWLRLRWPGSRGGFAGFVCLLANANTILPTLERGGKLDTALQQLKASEGTIPPNELINLEDVDDADDPTGVRPNNPQSQLTSQSPNEYLPPSTGYYAANSNENTLRCLRTGVVFPSSSVLTLLGGYDDGLTPPVTIPLEGQNVFCRICREGLHDDDENGLTETGENPLLSPCECSGSMAFVHYLCVEQWRCRSRHPEARNGTHCETCAKPYALPPPSSRPVSQVEEEWLEAMPPHVMAALRQPHFGWQIGAALVRRRWFRPMAPIFISPLVALYCRARRLLKKRGVSRRRWACSLCRRRARWKCVRCLRSYYCSRQCQNVSWHIVHKHVCYKPSRFWWSVVVYGAILLFMIPGILRDPLYYDLAFSFIPPSFYIMAVIGGGIATLVKKFSGVDMRGRILESVVVALTIWLVLISWGLVAGMFGRPQSCFGMFRASYKNSYVIQVVNRFILGNAKTYFLLLDQLAMRHLRVRKFLCTALDGGCFPHLSKVSPELLLSSPACVGDAQLVSAFWITAGATLAISALLKKRRRGGNQRLHQD